MKELAVIIDTSCLMYRSLYSKRDGDKTHPVAKKTIRYLLNIIDKYKPTYLVLSIDSNREEIYRKKISEDYKSNRKPRPKEIIEGLKIVKEFCDIFDIKYLEYPTQESDDIIASCVKNFEDNKIHSIVVTSDGDLTQLHSKYTRIAKLTMSSIKVLKTWKSVKENFGKIQVNKPSQVRELLALTGDKSDGIQNVPKVGIKRALDLLDKYSTIKKMYDSDDELPYNLREYEDLVLKNRNLVKLYNKIEVPELEQLKYGSFDYSKALSWMQNNGLAERLFNQIVDLSF